MKRRVLSIGVLALTLGLSAGAFAGGKSAPAKGNGSPPVLSADAAERAGLSPREAVDAGKLYTTKCMRCHKSYEPSQYTQQDWDTWMTKMGKKAHLGTEQQRLLGRYLQAYRADSRGALTNR